MCLYQQCHFLKSGIFFSFAQASGAPTKARMASSAKPPRTPTRRRRSPPETMGLLRQSGHPGQLVQVQPWKGKPSAQWTLSHPLFQGKICHLMRWANKNNRICIHTQTIRILGSPIWRYNLNKKSTLLQRLRQPHAKKCRTFERDCMVTFS